MIKKLMSEVDEYDLKSVTPLYSYLGLTGPPFIITPAAMVKIAFWAQNQSSCQRAEDALAGVIHIKFNDDTVRLAANYISGIDFKKTIVKQRTKLSTHWARANCACMQMYIHKRATFSTRTKQKSEYREKIYAIN
jgi:hypothetical protein